MALIDRVKARITTQKLIELTNKDSKTATAIDDTRLALAVTDAESSFAVFTGVAYDDTNGKHVPVAVRGVVAHLLLDSDLGGNAGEQYDRWKQMCLDLAKVTGRDRVTPQTTSVLTPSDEQSDAGETVRPDFDRLHLGRLAPDFLVADDDDE